MCCILFRVLQEALKQRRAPPADLSNLMAEEKLQRRNRMARALLQQAHARAQGGADGCAREGGFGAAVLYANQRTASVLILEPTMLLGR